jgi:putative ABC transport system permease protein
MFRILEESCRDLRYAARALRRTPAFTAVSVATLSLGIGATTAIFSVVNSALIAPLPYVGGERLVRLGTVIQGPDGGPRRIPVNLTAREREELTARTHSFDHVATAAPTIMNWRGREPRWQGARVSASMFAMLQARALLGRTFTENDERPGAHTVILSAAAWRTRFGGDPHILGRTIPLEEVLGPPNLAVYVVVGVMPDTFEYPNARIQFWVPTESTAGARAPRLPVVGQLREGISADVAAIEITPILTELARSARAANPNRPAGPAAREYLVLGEHEERVRLVRPALIAVSGAVVFVLLIACANVASLMLARTAARQREIAIRGAIGAGRWRLVRPALMESLVISALASLAGGVIAVAAVRLLGALTASAYRLDIDIDGRTTYPGIERIAVDGWVLAIAIGLAVVVAVLLAIVPAIQSVRHAESVMVVNSVGVTASARDGFNARSVLVVTEIALTLILLIGGALLMTSFVRLTHVNAGYEPQGVLTFQISLPVEQYPATRARDFSEALTARLERIPGISAVGYANQLPMVGLRDTSGGLWRTPDPTRRGGPPDAPDARIVSRDYLKMMGIPIVAGRGLSDADGEGAPRVLLVNEALARRDFNGRNAVGQTVYVGSDPEPWQIVGIVGNVRQFSLQLDPEPQFFFDARQWSGRGVPLFPGGAYYAVRLQAADPAAITAALRRAIRELEPAAIPFHLAPMEELVAETVGRPRLYAILLGLFAAIGLSLALVGIYGLIAYGVARRTRELGVRMALGAEQLSVLRMIVGSGLKLASIGIGLGLAGAAMTTRVLQALLFGVSASDLRIHVAVAILFLGAAAAASLVPAYRATRVNPVIALRTE